jgi:asparagine synthase (glutamine-hydrolysing)
MCGFCGEIRFDDGPIDLGALGAINATMEPRGPDGNGAFQQGRIALGHRRLSIIDLSTHANQPMVDNDLGLVIVFNGCVYNYKELRAELEAMGYRFFSHGDTEVVLKAFHAWGSPCVERFHGMFAFAIAERDTGRLTLVRDRLGIKPLYYAEPPGALRFASTLPALLAGGGIDTDLDPVALHHYICTSMPSCRRRTPPCAACANCRPRPSGSSRATFGYSSGSLFVRRRWCTFG